MRALLRVIVKEFQQLRRDRRMIPMIVAAPLLQIIIFGYAANLDVNDIPLALVDLDRTSASRALLDRFLASGRFDLAGVLETEKDIEPWLVDGRAQVALVIGAGYGDALAAGRAPHVQVIADGSDSTSAVVGLGYASRILEGLGAGIVASRIDRAGLAARAARAQSAPGSPPASAPILVPVQPPRIDLVPRVWYNPDLLSRWFYLPAILAMVLMLTTLILPSMAVVREKEIGTLEQLIVTPLRSWQIIAGKLLPFAIIGFIVLILVTGAVTAWFRVPLRGSWTVLLLLSVPFILTMLGMGLFVSTIARNQQQAMMSTIYLVMVPMIYLSGLIFPIENMPKPIQPVSYAIPLRYYAIILRGVFLKGAGLGALWREGLVLAAFAAGILVLSSLRFRKTLD